jgi:hypothetical protein
VLLLLANFGKEGKPEAVIPHITQETLAEMIVAPTSSHPRTIAMCRTKVWCAPVAVPRQQIEKSLAGTRWGRVSCLRFLILAFRAPKAPPSPEDLWKTRGRNRIAVSAARNCLLFRSPRDTYGYRTI